eukprot:6465479-Amphidinium_carterae.1
MALAVPTSAFYRRFPMQRNITSVTNGPTSACRLRNQHKTNSAKVQREVVVTTQPSRSKTKICWSWNDTEQSHMSCCNKTPFVWLVVWVPILHYSDLHLPANPSAMPLSTAPDCKRSKTRNVAVPKF